MQFDLKASRLRPWAMDDAASLAEHADNRNVWLHLRDFFPSPYHLADAETYLKRVVPVSPPTAMAIEVEGRACGGISAAMQPDVHRISAEIGYWLGEPYWGRGIMTEVVGAFTRYLFETFPLERVFAVPYANNPSSNRTLEKNGFVLEGRLRSSVIKDGEVLDQFLYAKTKDRQTPELQIRPYLRGDHTSIAEIFTRSIHEIACEVYSPEQCLAWSDREPNPEHWRKRCELKRPFVALVGSEIAGFLELDTNGRIDCAYISPKFKRRGIMTALVRHAVETCFNFRIDRVYVEASICARPLFEKIGFCVTRENMARIRGAELLNYHMEFLKPADNQD